MERAESAQTGLVLARIASRQGDTEGFDRAIEKALELEPGNLECRLERGATLVRRGNLIGAQSDLDWAVHQYPADARAHLEMGRLQAAEGRRKAALESFNRALSLNPAGCEAYLSRLEELIENGNEYLEAWHQMQDNCHEPEALERGAALMDAK